MLCLPAMFLATVLNEALADPEWQSFSMPNGVRVAVLEIPDAPKQATFTFLPLSLLDDEPHRAQFAHLVEHMLIRSTDPDTLAVDGLSLNGETGASSVRLDTLASRAKWREALQRHVRWITAREFDDDMVESEKPRILQEVENTAKSGFTHKWAAAAWNQVVRCGLDHAAVKGDIMQATAEHVRDYVRSHLAIDATVRIVTSGPARAEEVRAVLETEWKGLPDRQAATSTRIPTPTAGAKHVTDPRRATWDVDTTQYLQWYWLPDDLQKTRALAHVVAQLLTMQLMQDAALTEIGAKGMASADRVADEGRMIALSISVPKDADASIVERRARAAVDALESMDLLAMSAMFLPQLELPHDFTALRKQFASAPTADLIEAQAVLTLVHLEATSGSSAADLAREIRAFQAQDLKELLRSSLGSQRGRSLWLVPGRP